MEERKGWKKEGRKERRKEGDREERKRRDKNTNIAQKLQERKENK